MKNLTLIILTLCSYSSVASNEYRWLEGKNFGIFNQRQLDWQTQQELAVKEFEAKIPTIVSTTLKTLLSKPHQVDIPLKSQKLLNGAVLSLVLEKDTLKQKIKIDDQVIFDQRSIHPFNNFSTFSVDPLGLYLVVPVYSEGSTDRVSLYLFNIAERRLLMKLPDAYAYGTSWSGPHKFSFTLAGDNQGVAMLADPRDQSVQFAPEGNFFRAGDDNQFLTNTTSEYIDGNLESRLEIKVFGQEKIHRISMKHIDSEISYLGMKKRLDDTLIFEPYGRFNKTFCTLPYRFDFNRDASFGKLACQSLPTRGKISGFYHSGDHFIYETLYGFERKLHLFSTTGILLKEFNSPASGSLAGIKKGQGSNLTFTFRSPVKPKHEVEFNLETLAFDESKVSQDLMIDEGGEIYTTSYFSVPTSDNLTVPVRMIYKSTTPLDQSSKLFVEAYGGHGLITSFRPTFNRALSYFLKSDGISISPAVRGGGELGLSWHEAGRFLSKIKTYEDVENTVEYLHKVGIGSAQSTALMGWSSGGLMVNAVTSRRPELFKLVIPGNGLSDLIRKEILDLNFGNGWSLEYGGHINQEEIDFLKSYSPLIKAQSKREYPTTYIIAGSRDSRVNPAHSYKITQALQEFQVGTSPIIINTVKNSGHWPTSAGYMGLSGLETTQRLWSVIFSELDLSVEPLEGFLQEKSNSLAPTAELLIEEMSHNLKRKKYENEVLNSF